MRMWEIREGDSHKDDYRFGRRHSMGMRNYKEYDEDSVYAEGYECGFEAGYSKAMKDAFYSHEEKDSYGEKRMPR